MTRLLPTALFLAATAASAGPPPPGEVPGECGIATPQAPDFALEDVNPGSATYGETVTLDTLLDRVLVIYWAQAT